MAGSSAVRPIQVETLDELTVILIEEKEHDRANSEILISTEDILTCCSLNPYQ